MGKVYNCIYIQIYASTMTYFFIISNGKIRYEWLRTWSLLLSTEESVEGDIGHLDNLESDSGNISNGVTLSTETSYQHLIVLLNKVETTVIGDESSDLLSILDKLNSDTLSDSRVRLLSLYTNLLKNNSLSVGSSSERIGLISCSQICLLVILISPTVRELFL